MANIKTDSYFCREIAEGIQRQLDVQSENVRESTKFQLKEVGSEGLVEVSYDLDFINTLLYVTFNAGKYNKVRKQMEMENKDTV